MKFPLGPSVPSMSLRPLCGPLSLYGTLHPPMALYPLRPSAPSTALSPLYGPVPLTALCPLYDPLPPLQLSTACTALCLFYGSLPPLQSSIPKWPSAPPTALCPF